MGNISFGSWLTSMWILLWMFRYISSLSDIFFAFWFIIGHFNSYYLKSKNFSTETIKIFAIQYKQITHALSNWPAKVKVSENIIIKTQLSAYIIAVFSFQCRTIKTWVSVMKISARFWVKSLDKNVSVKVVMWSSKVKKGVIFRILTRQFGRGSGGRWTTNHESWSDRNWIILGKD